MTAVARRELGNTCYGKIFGYDSPHHGGRTSHAGNFLRDFNFKLANRSVGGFGKNFEFRADKVFNGVLRLDNARNAADVATVVRVLRTAHGRDNASGRGGGSAGVHAQLRGVFCRNFPRGHSSDTEGAIRSGKGVGAQALADDALRNFPASVARRPAANLKRNDKPSQGHVADLYLSDERLAEGGADNRPTRIRHDAVRYRGRVLSGNDGGTDVDL